MSTIRDTKVLYALAIFLCLLYLSLFFLVVYCVWCPRKQLPEVVPEESAAEAEPEFVHVVIVNPDNDVKVGVCKI